MNNKYNGKDQSLLLEEYKFLRSEIINCVNLNNSLTTFMATAVGAIFTFSFVYSEPLLFLLSYIFVIPLQCRIYHYRYNVAKISGYMVAVLEPQLKTIQWETRHMAVAITQEPFSIRYCRDYEGALLSLAATLTLTIYSLKVYTIESILENSFLTVALVIFALSAVSFSFFLSWKTNKVSAFRKEYVSKWLERLNEEESTGKKN